MSDNEVIAALFDDLKKRFLSFENKTNNQLEKINEKFDKHFDKLQEYNESRYVTREILKQYVKKDDIKSYPMIRMISTELLKALIVAVFSIVSFLIYNNNNL